MIYHLNYLSKSIFTPSITINCFKVNIGEELTIKLRDIVLKEEMNILNNVPLSNKDDDFDWITGRLWSYNFLSFDYDAVRELKTIIKTQYETFTRAIGAEPAPVYIQCWINIIKNNGRCISPHHHADAHAKSLSSSLPQEYSYVSGNLCVQTNETNTYFRGPILDKQLIPIKNVDGEMMLFPSFLVHWTDKNLYETPRITISFDIIQEEFYNMIDGSNYLKL
jgi:hypothetical protein